VNNIKNLSLFILNTVGLSSIFLYLADLLLAKNNWVFLAIYIFLLVLAALSRPKSLPGLLKISLLIRIIFTILNFPELSVSSLVFLCSSFSLEALVIISLSLELEEACYYNPNNRIICNPIAHQKIKMHFISNGDFFVNLVSISENYVTFNVERSLHIESIEQDGWVVLNGSSYSFRAKVFWKKGNYHCLELSRNNSLKDNHWPLIYDKIKSLRVL
jgi:hypothetical protein